MSNNNLAKMTEHVADPRAAAQEKQKLARIQRVKAVADESMRSGKLLNWAADQGYILTGGGQLNKFYTDYKDNELPHFHLKRGDCWEQFASWEKSPLLVGAWERPLFMGGFKAARSNSKNLNKMEN